MTGPRKKSRSKSRLPYRIDRDDRGSVRYRRVHEGRGSIDIKSVFGAGSNARPALIYVYRIPPGASEGVHRHARDDGGYDALDEYYYVASGRGVMQIAGREVAVRKGDHIYVPFGTSRGIENRSRGLLTVHVVAIKRR